MKVRTLVKKTPLSGLVLLLALLICVPSQSQPEKIWEIPVETPEFYSAAEALRNADIDTALISFKKIARENAGTSLGAEALGIVGRYSPAAEQKQILESIVTQYRGSRYAIWAQMNLSDIQGQGKAEAFNRAMDSYLRSLKAPTITEVVSQRHANLVKRYKALSFETRMGIMAIYDTALKGYTHEKIEYRKGFRLGHFCREAYPFNDSESIAGQIERNYEQGPYAKSIPPGSGRRGKRINPFLENLSPSRGSCGPRPKFEIRTYTGPFEYTQLALSHTTFVLDGFNVLDSVDVKCQLDEEMQGKKPYEVITFIYRPSQRLAPGRHTLVVEVQLNPYQKNSGYKEGYSKLEIPFTVGRERDDHEDEREDYDDD
jgi:hypothetical protein